MLVALATISVAISSPAKYCSVTIRKKTPKQYFHMVLFI